MNGNTSDPTSGVPGVPATPWQRFWARSLDLLLESIAARIAIGFLSGVFYTNLFKEHPWLIQFAIIVPSILFIDSLVYAVFGTTPGKALMGIRIVDDRTGKRLSFMGSIKRNFEVYIFGLGFNIPIFNWFLWYRAYRKLADGETLSWDQYAESTVVARSARWWRTSLVAAMYIVILSCSLGYEALVRERAVMNARADAVVKHRIDSYKELEDMAVTINNRGAMMVRPNNRFDSAHADPDLTFTYEYTMTAMSKPKLSAKALQAFNDSEQKRLSDAACAGHLMYMLRIAQTLHVHYVDKDGKELGTAHVTRADCKFIS